MLVVFTVYMVGVALLTLAERKVSAWIQGRLGPNRVGPGGLLQPAADGLKNIMKEETYPSQAYMPLFVLAPAISFIPALITWAVIPFGAPWDSPWGRLDMALAPLPIGFLYILAISSLGVYGMVLAGWSSNNKYAFLGGLRSSAQINLASMTISLHCGMTACHSRGSVKASPRWKICSSTPGTWASGARTDAGIERRRSQSPAAQTMPTVKPSPFPLSEGGGSINGADCPLN
jgi:NADH:ubiquinone oxidoreductase subunit H